MAPLAPAFTGAGQWVSYLVGSQGEGDGSQGLQELRGAPGRVLGVGAMHQAEELKHAGRESLFPGVVSITYWGLRVHLMRGVCGSQSIGNLGGRPPF